MECYGGHPAALNSYLGTVLVLVRNLSIYCKGSVLFFVFESPPHVWSVVLHRLSMSILSLHLSKGFWVRIYGTALPYQHGAVAAELITNLLSLFQHRSLK